MQHINVFVISHTYIARINRDKWKTLSLMYPEFVNIFVLIPTIWPTHLFTHKAKITNDEQTKNCKFISIPVICAGNEVIYRFKTKPLFLLLKKYKPKIIHVEQGDNALSYFQIIFLAKLLRLRSKFLFFTWINWKHNFSWKYTVFWKWIEVFNRHFSHMAIVGNHEAKRILLDKNFKKPITILPQLGVNTNIFRPAIDQTEGVICHPTACPKLDCEAGTHSVIKSPSKVIGFVGRLVPEKGVDLLIEAFSRLYKDFPQWSLSIVGDGPCKEELKNIIKKLSIEKETILKTTVSHENVAKIMKNFSILVLPSYDTDSWKEQFGHVLIEAMACKIPIIASNAGEIPNVIKNTGLLFEQKNIHSLCLCLQKLMKDADLQKDLGLKGYLKMQQEYTHEAISKKTYECWRKIL